MTRKTAPQLIHDLKPPIDSIHELTVILCEMCQNKLKNNASDLVLGMVKLTEMTETLCAYMQERHNEHDYDLKHIKKCSDTTIPFYTTIVVIDNDLTMADTLRFIARRHEKKIAIYENISKLFSELPHYTHDTAFFLDYDLGTSLNGIHVANKIYELGYKNLYIMSGYHIDHHDVPDYLKILNEKKDLLNFINKKTY